jgi:hypothetical protein
MLLRRRCAGLHSALVSCVIVLDEGQLEERLWSSLGKVAVEDPSVAASFQLAGARSCDNGSTILLNSRKSESGDAASQLTVPRSVASACTGLSRLASNRCLVMERT